MDAPTPRLRSRFPQWRRLGLVAAGALGLAAIVSSGGSVVRGAEPASQKVPESILRQAQVNGSTRVIVQLRVDWSPEGGLPVQGQDAQRQAIGAAQQAILSALGATGATLVRNFPTIPFQALQVTPDALAVLEASPLVVGLQEDQLMRPLLAESGPLVQADQAWAAGFDGTGQMVAILDTGVDKNHSFMGGRVAAEACYSGNSNCPNGSTSQVGSGAGVNCTYASDGCRHGTHVAGIAAGSGSSFSGIAKGAQIMAIQVFSRFTGANCGSGEDPCALSFVSDQVAALQHVYSLRTTYSIAAANMSLGGGGFTSTCDATNAATKAAIDNLRSAGIATVIASGNDGFTNAISAPACISTAISVGSTTKQDDVSFFSNSASFLSLLAPGSSINSSVPGGGFAVFSGTSMATPHVTGAWAILKQSSPSASVTTLLSALQSTGLPITDPGNGITKSRILIKDALDSLVPVLQAAPTSLPFGNVYVGSTKDLTVTVRNVGGGTLNGTGSITGAGFTLVGTASYSLTAGQAANLTVRFAPNSVTSFSGTLTLTGAAGATVPLSGSGLTPPTLTIVGPTTVTVGASVSVQLANGPGFPRDWVALHATSAADSVYLDWKYLSGTQTPPITGLTSATVTFTMPTTAGNYNFRFFQNNSGVKLATSATVTVQAATTPVIQVTPTSLAFGSVGVGGTKDLTVTVKNVGIGTLAGDGTVTGAGFSILGTATYSLTANQTAIVTVRFAPGGAGGASGTLTLTGGNGASVPLSGTGTLTPVLNVLGPTTVAAGSPVQVQVTNGPGFAQDWVALHVSSAADTVYLDWKYLNGTRTAPAAGVTSATLTFTMPMTLGTYNFRFFQNNSGVKLATSATVTVQASTSPVLQVTPTSLAFGNVAVGASKDLTVTVKNVGAGTLSGSGTVTGTGFSSVGNASYSLGANQTAVLTVRLAPAGAGAASGSLALTGGAGATVPLSGNGTLTPALTIVGPTTVAPGASVQVQVSNGPGFTKDWVAFHAASAGDTVFLDWQYLNGTRTAPVVGLTSATLTFTMPTVQGTYNFRFFQNDGFTKLATSPTVTVLQPSPSLAVSTTTATPGQIIQVTVSNGPGSPTDWVAMHAASAADNAYLDWMYLNGTRTATVGFSGATLNFTLPSTPGTYNFRFFKNNTYTKLATSPTVTVSAPMTSPTVTVSATTVNPSQAIQVTVADGPGNARDWVGMHATSAADTAYLDWTYLNGTKSPPVTGLTGATVTFNAPATPGTYEFRFFQNSTYTKLATSPTVTVAGPRPANDTSQTGSSSMAR